MQRRGVKLDGQAIAERRRQRAFTQAELADEAGVAKSTVEAAERGQSVSMRTWRSLSDALGRAPQTLLPKDAA